MVASSTRATKDEFDKAGTSWGLRMQGRIDSRPTVTLAVALVSHQQAVQGACQAKIGSWARGKAAWPHRDAMLGDPRALRRHCEHCSQGLWKISSGLHRFACAAESSGDFARPSPLPYCQSCQCQVAVAEGLEVLRDWVSENLETEKAARHRQV